MSKKPTKSNKCIKIYGAKEHNLKNLDISIPRDKLVVITGVSGSGKSSLAFDTIFAEGQRKYMESLSSYARQFLNQMHKPDIEGIEGLPPTIAIEQRSASHNPRSIVATTTEIHDYLRLFYARCGLPRCWHPVKKDGTPCGLPVERQSPTQIISTIVSWPEGTILQLLAPIVQGKKGFHRDILEKLLREGFSRIRVDGEIIMLDEVSLSDENPLNLGRYEMHNIEAVVSRTRIKEANQRQIADSIETCLQASDGTLISLTQEDKDSPVVESMFSEHFACTLHPECNLQKMEPRLFSFNSPFGACPSCGGLGTTQEFDLNLVFNPELTIAKGAFCGLAKLGYFYQRHYGRILTKICRSHGIDRHTPFGLLPPEEQDLLLYGPGEGQAKKSKTTFKGILHLMRNRMMETENEKVRDYLNQLLIQSPCPECHGKRLRKETAHIFLRSKKRGEASISEIINMSVAHAEEFFHDIELSAEQEKIAEPILREISTRLGFLRSVGLGYLSLDRKTSSLSGGEAQRIRLATQVGTGLVGVCYVLDEPTIGLHQRDNVRLIKTLRHLVDIGNTVIVVEHDEEMILSADHIIDIGPGPGIHGGTTVAQGKIADIKKNKNSITGRFLSGKEEISLRKTRRKLDESFALRAIGACENNLKKIDVNFPLGGLLCVTGVSGSGKSTLVNGVLLKSLRGHFSKKKKDQGGEHEKISGIEHIERIVAVDQSPIGRTPRSNPATYTGVFDDIRNLFAKTRDAISRGYLPGRFSFNVKGGRCEECQGQGTKKIEMHFLADVYVECETCQGKRYNAETLEVTYKGKNIADVLNMTVEEALGFFEVHPKLSRILTCLHQVGLDYVQLGQASTTLSGGEAQRVKLASELGRYTRVIGFNPHTVYILDEPTTGLHFADIKKVIEVFHSLVDMGNTVIVIEHNLDVIKCADWIIDLGPEGGDDGGQLITCGPPEKVVKAKKSYTGKFLKPLLGMPKTG
ncbi:MAG: excinuclease ABC subunit A [Halioglobus sp.]|jgi:excinuclease ABC subunit A